MRAPDRIKSAIANRYDAGDLFPRFNIAPGQEVLVLLDGNEQKEARMMLWGLIPAWSSEQKGFINARSETLEEKPSFSESFQRRRCLIPADGFYEWKRTGRSKQAFFFQRKDEAQFAFAGVWDRWEREGKFITSCAIITTTANELLSNIHDRMPVMLGPESYDRWLDSRTPIEELRQLLIPYPAREMKSHPVSSKVNHPQFDNEELIMRVDVEVGTTPSLF